MIRTTLTLLILLPSLFLNAQERVDLKDLDAYIASAVREFEQPGLAVGIVKDGKLLWAKGYGKLDLAKKDAVDPNTIFFLASISKAFTACAVGLLVDDGRLDWNDPVVEHLPWFRTPDAWVTEHMLVKDLLCHRSGWITFDGDLLWYGTGYDQREILQRHAAEPFTHPFRDEFGYSNLMYIAAAQLIEAVSGKTWDQFITERIITPLGMTRTTVETADLARFDNVALPHVRKDQDPEAPQVSMPYQALQGADGATGINSCVTDMAKWDAMWMNEGQVDGKPFLSPASFRAITSIHLPMSGRRDGAALGWFVEDFEGERVITHSGGMPGFILNHAVVPDRDLAVICLGNGESYSVFAITQEILDRYLGDGSKDPVATLMPRVRQRQAAEVQRRADRVAARITGTSPSLKPEAFTGTYTDKIYGDATIELVDGTLRLTLIPARELLTGPLEHWHYDTWRWDNADPFLEAGFVTFQFDTDHRVIGFTMDQHSPDFHFYKLDFRKVE